MIHQLIFARPRPGMTEADFQSYWLNVHAQRFARHIPQIGRYAIDFRIPVAGLPRELPGGYSVAEIWLANDEDQLASLQSPEFLEGARRDEPNWAAFWASFALDTEAQTLLEGPPFEADDPRVKLLVLMKRRPGMELDEFRRLAASKHADHVRGLPGLRHYVQGWARDGAYAIGEPWFDAVDQLWFDDEASLLAAIGPAYDPQWVGPHWQDLADPKHLFTLAVRAHWVIGPESREALPTPPAGDQDSLCEAVARGDHNAMVRILARRNDPNPRDPESGLSALMIAAGRGDEPAVKLLLKAGADVHTTDPHGGCTALHKACQGGNPEVARALVEAGAFVDAVAVTTGHTPLWDALWYKWPEIVGDLLTQGAGLGHKATYGFTLEEHIRFEEGVNPTPEAGEKFRIARELVEARRRSDQQAVARQGLMAAVVQGDLPRVRDLLAGGAEVDERAPRLNGFNDLHTPLLVACRDGHREIAAALIEAGADVNAVEPVFGAVPLHKAVYNGHAAITALLAEQPGIDLDVQGATNGYSPLHDALWHGFRDCASILIDKGARLDLRGHDGKTPLDIAVETFGEGDELADRLRRKGAEQGATVSQGRNTPGEGTTMDSLTTREVAQTWFDALTTGDIDRAIACLADDVEWINYTPVPGLNDIMPWIGTYHGVQAVMDSFLVFTSLVQVQREELVRLAVDGEEAAGVIYERSTVKETGLDFEIEFIQWLTIRGGKIVRWKSYTDPSPIIVAMRGEAPPA